MEQTTEAALRMIDEIIGRCIREPEFGIQALTNTEAALAPYGAWEDILDDFRALAKTRDEALAGWAEMRELLYEQ